MNTNKKIRGCIVTFPISSAGNTPLSNLISIIKLLTSNLYVITGNDGYDQVKTDKRVVSYCVNHETGKNKLTQIIKYIWTQLRISYQILQIRNKTDFYIFFIGGEGLLFPILTAKLLRSKVFLFLAGFPGFKPNEKRSNNIFSESIRVLSKITLSLSDKILVYSPRVVKERQLEGHQHKIFFTHEHFINFNEFTIKTPLKSRGERVGYVGRLSSEKGILNFIRAIPIICEKRKDVEFIIIGDGHLKREIEQFLDNNNLKNKVTLVGWIQHKDLPNYLNKFKLLVIPSYTEGLPNVMLEAIACGTPVLATPVGAIPDIITNTETGFILKNNSSKEIANNVMCILDNGKIDEITANAKDLIKREYTFECALKQFDKILKEGITRRIE